jgi:hypothetical protein
VLFAWSGGTYPNYEIRFTVLDSSSDWRMVFYPITLTTPGALHGSGYLSGLADTQGRAILTWMDETQYYRHNLYYALVDGDGNVLTQPMVFLSDTGPSPDMLSSLAGYGSAALLPPALVDLKISAPGLVGAAPAGQAAIPIHYQNNGGDAAPLTITATLDAGLSYLADTSGLTPEVNDTSVTWRLPRLGYFESGSFLLYVSVTGSDYGTRYPVGLAISSDGTDSNPADNACNLEVMIARMLYLPLARR